jgi:hypothetical protein
MRVSGRRHLSSALVRILRERRGKRTILTFGELGTRQRGGATGERATIIAIIVASRQLAAPPVDPEGG